MTNTAKIDSKNQISDEELFEKVIIHNDPIAFKEIYRRWNKRVLAYCLRAIDDEDDAKDVFQQVITNVYEKREGFKGGSFIAWLMIITRNQCLMHKRSRKNKVEISELENVLHDDTVDSDFKFKEIISEALLQLPDEFREVIELRYFDELSYEEIAELLKISLSLVKVRIFRAKSLLEKSLESYKDYYK